MVTKNVQVTARDEAMLAWLGTVRLSDVEAVRWALAGLGGEQRAEPVTLRAAQLWVARMTTAGLVERARPRADRGSIIWAATSWTGRAAPALYRATMRHDLAVAAASARFLAAGYAWRLDPATGTREAHVVDGIADGGGAPDFVEVELTPKTSARYGQIRSRFGWRFASEEVGRVFYLGTPGAITAVRNHLVDDRVMLASDVSHFQLVPAFDAAGRWVTDWMPPAPVTHESEGSS